MPLRSKPEVASPTTTLAPLAAEHAAAAARLHVVGQPGTFLTDLGPQVLTVLYSALPQSPVGFGFAATNQTALLGFVSATTSVGHLFVEMGTRRVHQLLPALLGRYWQRPRLALRSVQTVAYPFLASPPQETDESRAAELLSIMVTPSARGQGIGSQLLAALVQACRERAIALLDVTVAADNDGARRFYTRHGFRFQREFVLYGRAMCLYQLELDSSAHRAANVQPIANDR